MQLDHTQAALQVAGIEPSDTRRYPRIEIEAAIRDAYGVNVLVHCDKKLHLSEVGAVLEKKKEHE